MKARTFILTAGAALALAVPAANAATTTNGLYGARTHTVLAEKSHQTTVKGCTSKSSTAVTAAKRQGEVRQVVGVPIPPGDGTAAITSPTVVRANGNDVILPDGSVYQANDDGSYSWIPDVATANAMGLDWNSLQSVDTLPGPVAAQFAAVVGPANPSFGRLSTASSVSGSANDLQVSPE